MGRPRVRRAAAWALAALAVSMAAPVPAAAAAPALRQPVEWVVMGDSYTAGVIGATGAEVEARRDGCARTVRSYPEVVRRDLGTRVSLRNVSCGGATVRDIFADRQVPGGRPPRWDVPGPGAAFAPVPPQVEAVTRDTGVVSVGVGMSTLGFGQILARCADLGRRTGNAGTPCRDEFGADLPRRLAQVRADYDRMLAAVHARARAARVVTVGYPRVFPEDSAACTYGDPLQFAAITSGDLDWARTEMLEPLNSVIRQVTARHGDTYVDQYASTRGHSVCDREDGANWVDGLLSGLTPPRPALVHPNSRGHANAAADLEEAVPVAAPAGGS